MARKKNPTNNPTVTPKAPVEKAAYAFPTKSRCPRCRALDTKATSTQGKIQHRQCQRGHCRFRYTVRGDKI